MYGGFYERQTDYIYQRTSGLHVLFRNSDNCSGTHYHSLLQLSDRTDHLLPSVRLSMLNAICKALHCQPDDILEYVDDENKEQN